MKVACITLDLEEDWRIPADDANPTFEYVDDYINMIEKLEIPISIFVVGRTLGRYPERIERFQIALDAEFHLHSFQHDISKNSPFDKEIRKGCDAFQSFFGRDPVAIGPHRVTLLSTK